jgi:hypothetical protein
MLGERRRERREYVPNGRVSHTAEPRNVVRVFAVPWFELLSAMAFDGPASSTDTTFDGTIDK